MALERLLAVVVEDEVVADRQRRQRRVALPGRAECRRSSASPPSKPNASLARSKRQSPSPRRSTFSPTRSTTRSVMAVAVHVERVCPGDVGQVRDRVGPGAEAQRAAGRALVAVERRRLGAAGEVEVGTRVVVAVERRHAAADEERELTVVAVLDAGGRRLLDEAGQDRAPREASRRRSAQNPSAAPRADRTRPARRARIPRPARPRRTSEDAQRARRPVVAGREELLDDAQVGDRVPRVDRRRPAVEDRRRELLGLDGVRVRRLRR